MTTPTNRAAELGNLSVLSQEECLTLLATASIGRLGFVGPSGVVIHPLNYIVDHESIVVRTSPHTMLGEHAAGQVAFEVDELDAWMTQGWSVLVTGQLAPIDDPEETIAIHRQGRLRPWADGQRNLYLRITPQQISGRRIS